MNWMKILVCLSLLICGSSLMAQANSGIEAIEHAKSTDKYLFIFFYKDQSSRTLKAQCKFDQAIQKLAGQSEFVKVNAKDPGEKLIVEKFDLKRTPMPFVIVLAPNGAITGGFPSSFTEEQLLASFTSPGAANCLKALQDRRLVILMLQNGQTSDNEAALKGAREFKSDPRFASATEIVMIDPADLQEQKFLSQLNLDTRSSQATTVLIAPPSEVVGKYLGPTNKDQFISDLQKAASDCCGPGGCCPGGRCCG